MKKSNAEHQADHKARQIALGYVRRYYFATPSEHIYIKSMLEQLRLRGEARQLAEGSK